MNRRGEQAAMRARHGSVRRSGARKAKEKKTPLVKKNAAEWLTEYLDYLTGERGYAGNTINAYRSDLGQFREALAKDLLTASTDDIRKFVLFCLEGGVSPKTARRKLSSVKGFYQFVFDECGPSRDPSRDIRAPKAFKAIIRPIARSEVDQILASLGTERPLDLRDRALVYVAYGSGLRVSEAANLRIADIDFQHATAKVRLGKGQKDRRVPLNEPEIVAIRLYLEKGRPQIATKPDNGLLFVGRLGDPLTRQRLWQVLTRMSQRVVGRQISPHKYRHSFVTDTINGGADPRVVQTILGHASVRTTMGYMHSNIERIRTEYLHAHPRGVAQ